MQRVAHFVVLGDRRLQGNEKGDGFRKGSTRPTHLALILWNAPITPRLKTDQKSSSKFDALLAARPTILARLAVFGLNPFAIWAIVVVVVHVPMLRSFFIGFCMIRSNLSHLIASN